MILVSGKKYQDMVKLKNSYKEELVKNKELLKTSERRNFILLEEKSKATNLFCQKLKVLEEKLNHKQEENAELELKYNLLKKDYNKKLETIKKYRKAVGSKGGLVKKLNQKEKRIVELEKEIEVWKKDKYKVKRLRDATEPKMKMNYKLNNSKNGQVKAILRDMYHE